MRRQRFERVALLDRHHEAAYRRNGELLPNVELILGSQLVGPPKSHHRYAVVAGNSRQRVAGFDGIGLEQALAIGDDGVDCNRLVQRPVVGVTLNGWRGKVSLIAHGSGCTEPSRHLYGIKLVAGATNGDSGGGPRAVNGTG